MKAVIFTNSKNNENKQIVKDSFFQKRRPVNSFQKIFKNKILFVYFIFKILRITNRASPITSISPDDLKVSGSYSR